MLLGRKKERSVENQAWRKQLNDPDFILYLKSEVTEGVPVTTHLESLLERDRKRQNGDFISECFPLHEHAQIKQALDKLEARGLITSALRCLGPGTNYGLTEFGLEALQQNPAPLYPPPPVKGYHYAYDDEHH